jgi:predicted nucleotidyltransferase
MGVIFRLVLFYGVIAVISCECCISIQDQIKREYEYKKYSDFNTRNISAYNPCFNLSIFTSTTAGDVWRQMKPKDRLNLYYQAVNEIILSKQNPATGLV